MFQTAARTHHRSLVATATLPRFQSFIQKPAAAAAQSRRMHFDSYLVTPKQLHDALQKPSSQDIIPLCASWFLPNDPDRRTGRQTYTAQRIPGARFFDLDGVKDPHSPYPHMLPSAADFARAMGELGIRNSDTVVVYDTKELGIFSAPRVAWTLKAFGHARTHLLNNFRLWTQQGYATESGEPGPVHATTYDIDAARSPASAVDFEYVKGVAKGETDAQVLDARPKGRFDGVDAEPRPGLPSGHMPRSISLPFGELLDPDTKAFLPPAQLKEVLAAKGVAGGKLLVSSCGTGVTAAIIDTALAEAGYPPEVRLLYDGSWTEWAQRVKPEENLITGGK